jgi:hypothetical protein
MADIFEFERIPIDISGTEHFIQHKVNALNYFIYQLQDPFTFEICYIGKTNDPVERYNNHCNSNLSRGNGRFSLWLYYLASKNKKPIIRFVWHIKGICAKEEISRIEGNEIKSHWELGHPLLNQTMKKREITSRIKNSDFWMLVELWCREGLLYK